MTRSSERTSQAVFAAAVLALAAVTAGAQATDVRSAPSLVRVTVADSAGVPVAGAEVLLLRGLKDVIAAAHTDAAGEHAFIVNLDSTDYSILARQNGYARGDRFFAALRKTVDVVVTLHTAEVEPTELSSAERLRHRSYHIEADEITASDARLESALDVVVRLRPDIVTSRSGTWGGGSRFGCPTIQSFWVNDHRYVSEFTSPSLNIAVRAAGPGNRAARLGAGNMTLLSEIAPEHIEAIDYRDCLDSTEGRFGTTNALFITLKDGVGYRPGRGTFVMVDAATKVVQKQ